MFQSINEMVFSTHYTNDNRGENYTSLNRIRNISLNNSLEDRTKAIYRLRMILMHYAVFLMDKKQVTKHISMAFILPKISFKKTDGSIVPADIIIKNDVKGEGGNRGNSYLFIVRDNTAITTYLCSNDLSTIIKNVQEHENRENVKKHITKFYSLIDGHEYKRAIDDKLIIDLTLDDIEFRKKYRPFVKLRDNDISTALTSEEIEMQKDSKVKYDVDRFNDRPNKYYHKRKIETSFGKPGEEILFLKDDEIKIVKIIFIERTKDINNKYQYTLYFSYNNQNLVKQFKIGDNIVLQPKVQLPDVRKFMEIPDDVKHPIYYARLEELSWYKKGKDNIPYERMVLRGTPFNWTTSEDIQ